MAIKITLLTVLGMLLCCGSEPAAVRDTGDEDAAPVSEAVIEPVNEAVNEPLVEPADEPVTGTVPEPVTGTVPEPVTGTVPEPVIETVDEPAMEVVGGSVTVTASEPVIETVTVTVSEPVIEVVGEQAPEPTPEPAAADQPPTLVVDAWNPTDELLERLERSHADLVDFQARIRYEKWDNVLKKSEIRIGEVLYQRKPEGTKRFAILLERLIRRNRAREHRKHYVFDGSWLVEIDHEAKIFIKRQIVPPDKQFDPLKLGEGPFPLPIGQSADEVRARFKVRRLLKPKDETLAEGLAGRPVDGLLLVPKPGTPQAKEFKEAELFYDRESSLPVGVSVTEVNGDRKTVILSDLKRNAGVDERKLSIEEPDPRDGWRKDIEPWQDR